MVLRNTHNYQVVDRFNPAGVGPLELALMPDSKTRRLLTRPASLSSLALECDNH
jgi:hypothetical protein